MIRIIYVYTLHNYTINSPLSHYSHACRCRANLNNTIRSTPGEKKRTYHVGMFADFRKRNFAFLRAGFEQSSKILVIPNSALFRSFYAMYVRILAARNVFKSFKGTSSRKISLTICGC